MDSLSFRELLPQITRTQKSVWWIVNILQILYFIPLYGRQLSYKSIENIDTSELLFSLLLSVVCAGGAYVYRQWALAPERLRQILATDVTPDMLRTAFGGINDKFVTQIRALPQEEQRQVYLVKKLETVMIVGLFIHGVIAAWGVSLALPKNDLISFVPFFIAALALNLFIYPKPEQVLQRLQKEERALGARASVNRGS